MKLKYLMAIGLILVSLVAFVVADLLPNQNVADYSCKGDFCHKSSVTIDFDTITDGYEINGIKITSSNSGDVSVVESRDDYVRFVPEIVKDFGSSEVEYTFSKQPDRVREHLYFKNPLKFAEYLGGSSTDDLEKICEKGEPKCNHATYKYLVFTWNDENIELNTRKQDENQIYNIERSKDGFKVTNLEGVTSVSANDFATSTGKIYIDNGMTTNCTALINYTIEAVPECMYLNTSLNLNNLTTIDLRCELHINGTLGCNEAGLRFNLDDIASLTGIVFYNGSRFNMTASHIEYRSVNATMDDYHPTVTYHNNIRNWSQYFKQTTISGLYQKGALSYWNMTGDNVNFNWIAPSDLILAETIPSRINGVGNGITYTGDSVAFPITIEGLVNFDMRDAITGWCFYLWVAKFYGELTGGTHNCGVNGWIFSGAIPPTAGQMHANFTDPIIIKTGAWKGQFGSQWNIKLYYTQNYSLGTSVTDEPASMNTTIYTTDTSGAFSDIRYDENYVTRMDVPILWRHWTNVPTAKIGIFKGRVVFQNDSYFTENATIDFNVSHFGEKSFVKIPERMHLIKGGGVLHL